MAYVQRPCVCGGTNFCALPDIRVLYIEGSSHYDNWVMTAVVCTACGRTEMFTNNLEQVASNINRARMIAAGGS